MRLSLVPVAIVVATVAVGAGPQAPQPSFRAGVEVVPVDVGVVDRTGAPIPGLGPADFTVRIGGQVRRVVSAEWVSQGAAPGTDRGGVEQELAPAGFSTNESALGGRLIVIAVDEPNIRFGSTTQIMRAVSGLIDTLTPADRVAVVSFGQGSISTPFLADFAKAKEAVSRMNGSRRGLAQKYSISQSEALAILHSAPGVLESVIARECEMARRVNRAALNYCEAEVGYEANELGRQTDMQARDTFQGLRSLFTGLKSYDAPKTVILISEGFISDDETTVAQELGGMAASARANLYTLRLDEEVFDLGNARRPIAPSADRRLRANGLEVLSTTAGGDLFTIVASSDPIFKRIESELSGYYLLGIESDPRDADGKAKPIAVDVSRAGALVRAHRQFLDARASAQGGATQDAVTAALASPLPVSALPLRVGAFALRGPESGKVQLLLRADIGAEYDAARLVTIGYAIADASGRVVESQVTNTRLSPAKPGTPSALQFVGGASVLPGDYRIKFVAVEGGRAGTVEHIVHAALGTQAGVTISDLLVGGPADVDLFTPSAGYAVRFGNVHGYMEVYGPQARQVAVTYEVAADESAPYVLSADVKGRPVGDDRVIFSEAVSVKELPAGPYVLRAKISAAGQPVTVLTRPFQVESQRQ